MTDRSDRKPASEKNSINDEQSKWGVRLFMGTSLAVLVFFWWLLIYSGGVVGHHG